MKLKEKLAKEFCETYIGHSALRYEGFLAGFEKAKELSLQAIYDSDGDPTGHVESCVRAIGEEEVSEDK